MAIDDLAADPRAAEPNHASIGARSALAVPLVREGRMRAIVYAMSTAGRPTTCRW